MRIDGSGSGPVDGARDSGKTDEVKPNRRHRSPKSDGGDAEPSEKVAISGRARDIAKAREAAHAAPDVDEAKIAKLKAAIQSGAYGVDADKVAERLVEEHLHTMF